MFRLSRFGSSEKSRYRYLSVFFKKKFFILFLGWGLRGFWTLLMEEKSFEGICTRVKAAV